MLINIGEAYIVVNIVYGSLIENDQDLQSILEHGRTIDGYEIGKDSLHIENLDIHADDDSPKLKLKIYGGPSAGEIYYYKEEPSFRITMGRAVKSDI